MSLYLFKYDFICSSDTPFCLRRARSFAFEVVSEETSMLNVEFSAVNAAFSSANKVFYR
jgi:hypothetical protein